MIITKNNAVSRSGGASGNKQAVKKEEGVEFREPFFLRFTQKQPAEYKPYQPITHPFCVDWGDIFKDGYNVEASENTPFAPAEIFNPLEGSLNYHLFPKEDRVVLHLRAIISCVSIGSPTDYVRYLTSFEGTALEQTETSNVWRQAFRAVPLEPAREKNENTVKEGESAWLDVVYTYAFFDIREGSYSLPPDWRDLDDGFLVLNLELWAGYDTVARVEDVEIKIMIQ